MPEKEPRDEDKQVASEGDGLNADLPPPKEVSERRSKLKNKWKRFAKAIVKGYDYADAATFAGYEGKNNDQLRQRGWQLIRRPEIQDEIRRLEELADKETVEGDMIPTANEVTMNAAEIMRDQQQEAKDRLQAANLIAKLHGYHAPVKQQHDVNAKHDYQIQFVRVDDQGNEKQVIDAEGGEVKQLDDGEGESQDNSDPFTDAVVSNSDDGEEEEG